MSDNPTVTWDEEGRPYWSHQCLSGVVETQLPLAPDRWQKGDGDSITPSINCRVCDTHGWWTNGQWFRSGGTHPVTAHLAERRSDPEFRARLRHRVAADRQVLDRLADPTPAPTCSPPAGPDNGRGTT